MNGVYRMFVSHHGSICFTFMVIILFNQRLSLYHFMVGVGGWVMGVGPVLYNKNLGKCWRFNFNLNLYGVRSLGVKLGGCGGEPGGARTQIQIFYTSSIILSKKMVRFFGNKLFSFSPGGESWVEHFTAVQFALKHSSFIVNTLLLFEVQATFQRQ